MLVAALLLAGCGGGTDEAASPPGPPPVTAATLGEQEILATAEYLAQERFATADLEYGERLGMQCRACHTLEKGGAHMLGPALHGFFGRQAGVIEGYAFSPALANSEFRWTPDALDAWLAQPAVFLPGNRMAYAGLRKEDDRRAVIAWLLQATADE